MAVIVVYDPSDPDVPNRVTKHIQSAHTPDYDSETNKLTNPDLSALSSVPVHHRKYDGTSAIVEMSQAEKDALVVLITSHGVSSGLVDTEIVITEDTTWQNLGGRVTNLASLMFLKFGHTDMSRAFARVPFRVKSDGAGAEIRLISVEEDGTITSLLATAHDVGDTLDAWKYHVFTTDVVPSSFYRLYCLQGRLNGATSATIGQVAMTLLDVGP